MGLRRKLAEVASAALRPDSLLGAGAEAPSFELLAHDGERIRSEDLLGECHYVLIFYPGDDTPGCTVQLREFSARKELFEEANCKVFGVNAAGLESHRSFAQEQCYSLRLLVDQNRELAIAYRTARSGVPVTFRAVFVVDRTGVVRSAMKDFPSPDAVLDVVRRCNETGYKRTGRKGRQLVPEVSGYGARKMMENDPRTGVLDIRDVADWRAGHIPGAVNVPIDALSDSLGALPDRSLPLVIACDQGLRAKAAARLLHEAGWNRLFTLIDGMEAYKGELETPVPE